jgi:hypothetical protein
MMRVEKRVIVKKILFLVLICSAGLYAQDAVTPKTDGDAWKSLRFLFGTWEAKTGGGSAGAASQGSYFFRLELRDHILARHTISAGCTGPADFDCEHQDLLYVYPESAGKPFRAIFFDNEGHVIHYDVLTPSATTAVFLSDPSQPGPQYRLRYELVGTIMHGTFQMRMPGQTEFKSYLEWSGGKRTRGM